MYWSVCKLRMTLPLLGVRKNRMLGRRTCGRWVGLSMEGLPLPLPVSFSSVLQYFSLVCIQYSHCIVSIVYSVPMRTWTYFLAPLYILQNSFAYSAAKGCILYEMCALLATQILWNGTASGDHQRSKLGYWKTWIIRFYWKHLFCWFHFTQKHSRWLLSVLCKHFTVSSYWKQCAQGKFHLMLIAFRALCRRSAMVLCQLPQPQENQLTTPWTVNWKLIESLF